jgi:hypothetical protein
MFSEIKFNTVVETPSDKTGIGGQILIEFSDVKFDEILSGVSQGFCACGLTA